MRTPADFATERFPVHSSGTPGLARCDWKTLLTFVSEPDDQPGAAADTGSALHKAVHIWHRDGYSEATAVEGMTTHHPDYPSADLQEAAAMFLHYAADPRNREAEVVALERPITFAMEPAPEDPTGKPVVFVGKLDQVRRVDGVLKVFDLKTSKLAGWKLMMDHLWQVMVYSVGATKVMGEPVHPGALIRTRSYPSHAGVFWGYTTTLEQSYAAFDGLRHRIANIRAGKVVPSPGDWCQWCIARSFESCLPLLEESSREHFVNLSKERLRLY